jgi:hypothetical protein
MRFALRALLALSTLVFAGGAFAATRVGMVSVFIPTAVDASEQQALFDRARDWYRDMLGFDGPMVDEALDAPGTAGRWLQLSLADDPELSLVFKAGRPVVDNAIFTLTPSTPAELCALYARLSSHGVSFDMPPTANPWAFEMMFRDPFGQGIVAGVAAVPGAAETPSCKQAGR